MKKGRWIAIIIGVIVAISGGLAGPLFYETSVDESLPNELNAIEQGLTFEKFVDMDDSARQPIVDSMSSKVQEMIMTKAASITTKVSEDMDSSDKIQVLKIGEFQGVAGHESSGIAKILDVANSTYLRFEDFYVTNGPDLRVYLTNNGDVKNGIHLEKLKGNKGNQNYLLENTDWQGYDTVVIYCQPFGVHFGEAKLAHASVQEDEEVFFTLQGDNQVGTLDSVRFDAGPTMTYLDVKNDKSVVLATSSGSDVVYVFESDKTTTVPVGHTPKGIKIHPDGKIAFVANEAAGTISVIDMNALAVEKEFKVGQMPHNIRFDLDGSTAYVTLQGEDKIAVVDVANLKVTELITVEKMPHNLDLSPDGKYLYVANIGTSDVAVIDIDAKKIIKRIEVSAGHHGIDVTNDGTRIYVSGIGSDKVNVIDADSLELIKQIDVGDGPHGIRASKDGSLVYVGITTTDEIVIIDSETLKIKERIQTGDMPFWIAIPNNP